MYSGPLYHVIPLSNFSRGFDKYRREYRKSSIPESRYPTESYLLRREDLATGVAKASKLRDKLAIPGDVPLVLQVEVPPAVVRPNLRSGVGLVWPSPDLPIAGVLRVSPDGQLGAPLSLEDAMARSLELNAPAFIPYTALRPRSVSLLPIARGCQAACPFCFSEASVSVDQPNKRFDALRAVDWLDLAAARGAERAVITGGGEPTLLPSARLRELVAACSRRFRKTVLITNGVRLVDGAAASSPRSVRQRADCVGGFSSPP